MRMFHASRKRFENFDMNFVGTGQEVNRYAHGIHLGEAEPVAEYISTYQYLDDADTTYTDIDDNIVDEPSLPGLGDEYKGVCYEVNIPKSVIRDLKRWEDDADIDLLNAVAVELFKEKGLITQLEDIEGELESAGFEYDITDDIEKFIDDMGECLYYLASEEGISSHVESEHIKQYLFRKFRHDDYTNGEFDDDFVEYLDNTLMDLFESAVKSDFTIEDEFTHGNLYEAVTIAFSPKNEMSKDYQKDMIAKKQASMLLSKQGIVGYIAPSMHGRHGALEVIVIDSDVAKSLTISEISKEAIKRMDSELDNDDMSY